MIVLELYSTALSLWFGEYVYEWYDEEEYEDTDRMLSLKRVEGHPLTVRIIKNNCVKTVTYNAKVTLFVKA